MKVRFLFSVLVILLATYFQSCNKDETVDIPITHDVKRLEEVLTGSDQNLIQLLNKVRGSVGTRGPASKTIWSRKNNYGLGLYISANHVYNLSGWTSRNAQFFDPNTENLGIFASSQIPSVTGALALEDTMIADFPLMHFNISPNATNTGILPEEDFYLGIVDNQRHKQTLLAVHPGLVDTTQPLTMFDPGNRSVADLTWATATPGQHAIGVGYPQDKENYPNGAVAYGKIMSDTEAEKTIIKLRATGDIEGDIAYNPRAEFFLDAEGITGMSGGGVFNMEGQLLGIMVRASDAAGAPKIIRVVRASFIRYQMIAFFNKLSTANKNKIEPFIRGEL